jgi:DNA processing protein
LSELPPGAPPLPQHFPFRNRIISALARAVVVVEARENSGSLITARHALDQGIEVLAVPGPISAATSRGPNRLLRDGAAPVLEARDVLEAIGHRVPDSAARPPRRAPDTPRSRAVLRALGVEPCTRDELARRLRLAPEEVATAVVALELEGRVVEDRDGRLMRIGS